MSLIQNVDNSILIYIKNKMHGHIIDKVMVAFTYMGNGGIIWIFMAIVLLLNKQYRLIGGIVILTLITSTIIGEGIIKHIVRRVRPCNYQDNMSLLILKPVDYSFPSGHTLSSFAVAQVLSIYFDKYGIIFMVIAFCIALSRVYLLVHYPTDVIAGIILGILCSKFVVITLQEGYIRKLVAFYQKLYM
jgi:undecaprenyl-diphosphatase